MSTNHKQEANRLKQQNFERRMKDENRRKVTFYPRSKDVEKAVKHYRKVTNTNKTNITREAITATFESALNQQFPLTEQNNTNTQQQELAQKIKELEHQLNQAETQRDIAKANADEYQQQIEIYKAKIQKKRQDLADKKLDSPRWKNLADFVSELEKV